MPTGDAYVFDLPAQALALALLAFCQATGSEMLVPAERLDGRVSSPVTGARTPREALTALLRETGLRGGNPRADRLNQVWACEAMDGRLRAMARPTPDAPHQVERSLIRHADKIDYRGPAVMLEDAPPTIIVWARTENEAAEKAAAACRELGVVERKSASREAPKGGWTRTTWVKFPA